ncbi:MAG: IS1634 family transposase [Planctomycetes bacterium]|nr:IS1634 family transposase [Planctomycetota bacterium]
MFLRSYKRKKNGKWHEYFSVVENRRLAGDKSVQRTVLYLGEISGSQEDAWRKTLEVFDQDAGKTFTKSLFADDGEITSDAIDSIKVKLSQMQLCRPRSFGDCWLSCELWRRLGLDEFWSERLGVSHSGIPWSKVLTLLVVNRLIRPGSEFYIHRQWFDQTAMDELLRTDYRIAAKDRLYRCLDRILRHKEELCKHLKSKWEDMFGIEFDVLLYDLTSTYFEGLCEQNPKARFGYSRDKRSDCRQVVIALIVTPEGFPLGYDVLPGNTLDKTTLRLFLDKIESMYGKARRVWVMDRGIPTEETLSFMRDNGLHYLVGTPRSMLNRFEEKLLDLDWKRANDNVVVKLLSNDNELYVLAKSKDRRAKERAMRKHKLRKYLEGLEKLRKNCRSRDRLLERLGALKQQAGKSSKCVDLTIPSQGGRVTPENFSYTLNTEAYKKTILRDGMYLLRTNSTETEPDVIWRRYVLLTQVEAAFKSLKSDLAIRPVYHQLEHRVDAHIFVAFLAYCLMVTLRQKLSFGAPGLTARDVLDKLGTIKMIDVRIPTADGRMLEMRRYSQPEIEHRIILDKLKMDLPAQPPPKVYSRQLK